MSRAIKSLAVKAERMALLAQFIETFDDAKERRLFIERLCRAQIMSPSSAYLLIEEYGLESAL